MRLLFYFCILFVISCQNNSSSVNKINNEIQLEEKLDLIRLSDSLNALIILKGKLNNKEAQLLYLDLFPNNFKNFKIIFGFEEINEIFKKGYLYDSSLIYISTFFNKLNYIDPQKISYKAINISIDAEWQSDGVNIFQHFLREHLNQHISLYVKLLRERDKLQINSFWNFYFSGPHPDNDLYEFKKIYYQINNIDTNISLILKKSYENNFSMIQSH